MMAVLVLSKEELSGMEQIREMADRAKNIFADKRPAIIGPSEASIARINDIYRYIFYIKHRDYQVLVEIKDDLEKFINTMQWSPDSVQFDFDPMSNY